MQSPVQEGSVLRDKYRVERVLGHGGMGVVVAAWHLRLEQRVAIKILRPELIQNHEHVERFLREARAASKIEGDHVVRVTDVETLDDGTPFMVMEYLEGRDLAWVRDQGKPLAAGEAVDYLLQACEAIAEAHARGIIHRDIKPGNIFLARRRDGRTRIKVLDFGISKLADASGDNGNLTATTAIMGSAEYMSPEQMQSSRDVDERTDIWALGVSLYELCTARGPFEAPSLREVCVRVLSLDPTPPRAQNPAIPPGLEAVIMRCLHKDREQRYATIAALCAALAPFAAANTAPVDAARPSLASLPGNVAPALPLVGTAPTAPPSPTLGRVPLAWVIGALGVGLLATILAFALGRGRSTSDSASAAPSASTGTGSSRFRFEAELVIDAKTRLAWQRRPPGGPVTFSAANAYCASARGNAFRLPTQEELAALAISARQNIASPGEVLGSTSSEYFWSSSVVDGEPNLRWLVRFGDGEATSSSPNGTARVRCVR